MKGQCVINLLLTRLEIMNMELSLEMGRSIIQTKSGRLKSYKSTCKKLEKKGLKRNVQAVLKKIHDLIGVRAICYYVDDIYRIEKKLKEQSDFRIVKVKDYIKNPKTSGYRSLHLIMEIPIGFQGGTQWMKAELQLRTAAMDYWANLDHQLRYKKGRREAELIDNELQKCSETIGKLDQTMLEIRKKIDKI